MIFLQIILQWDKLVKTWFREREGEHDSKYSYRCRLIIKERRAVTDK